MKHVMIVETRDPLVTREVQSNSDLLASMRQAGIGCTMMLAENGVLGARAAANAQFLQLMMESGVKIAVDRFALAERGIFETDLIPGINCADLSLVIDHLAAGDTVMWR